MYFLEVFVSPAYRVSKEHLFICNGVATLEDSFLSRLSTVSLVTLSSWRPDAEQLRAARCSVQCPASALLIPPPEHFGSQVPQPIGWVCRLLYWLNKHGVSGVFCFLWKRVGVFSAWFCTSQTKSEKSNPHFQLNSTDIHATSKNFLSGLELMDQTHTHSVPPAPGHLLRLTVLF